MAAALKRLLPLADRVLVQRYGISFVMLNTNFKHRANALDITSLDASWHLYMRVCPSVRPSVGPSETHSLNWPKSDIWPVITKRK